MKLPEKHRPVLINEVVEIFLQTQSSLSDLVCIDCTLGQAGHSFEIFNKLKRGVLLSIDLFLDSIEWTAANFGFDDNFEKVDENKKWILVQDNFANLQRILEEKGLKNFDFLIADLGFSNFQLSSNLGISYSSKQQILDMRYGTDGSKASEILNQAQKFEIEEMLMKYSDLPINLIQETAKRLTSFKKSQTFEKVSDVDRALGNISRNVESKLFQALRIVVNKEDEKLKKLCESIKTLQSENGVSLIITFNKFEEEILQQSFGSHEIIEPNIKEIISNQQSRSAKLHIYKTKSN